MNSSTSEALLYAILKTVARQTFAEDKVREIVVQRSNTKQLAAYNLCDGTLTQAEIVKRSGLDTGNFSRTITRWIDAGIVFRIPDGKDTRLLHVFPLPE